MGRREEPETRCRPARRPIDAAARPNAMPRFGSASSIHAAKMPHRLFPMNDVAIHPRPKSGDQFRDLTGRQHDLEAHAGPPVSAKGIWEGTTNVRLSEPNVIRSSSAIRPRAAVTNRNRLASAPRQRAIPGEPWSSTGKDARMPLFSWLRGTGASRWATA